MSNEGAGVIPRVQTGDDEYGIPQRISVENFAELLDGVSRPLFVVGSAVSKEAPASAPGAPEVLRATMRALADLAGFREDDSDAELAALFDPPREVLPECLYAAIAEIFPPGVHETIWGALAAEPKIGAPNLGHLWIALATVRAGGAIITTNFDTFLEDAITKVGGQCEMLTGRDLWEGRRPRLASDSVLVLKIHGAAERPDSIVSKTPDLARTARVLRMSGLAGLFKTAVIIGYSGKDFDVFPWVAAASGIRSSVWVDLPEEFDSALHRSRDAPRCLAVGVRAEALAEQLLRRSADQGDEGAQRILHEHRGIEATCPGEPSLTDRVLHTAKTVVKSLPSERRTAARWVLGRVFADIGRHKLAERLTAVEPGGSGVDHIELMLLRSFIVASRDRYAAANDLANEAAKSALAIEDPRIRRALQSRARLQSAYAGVLYNSLSIDLPEIHTSESGARTGSRYGLRPSAAFLGSLVREAPHGILAIWKAWRAPFGKITTEFRLSCDYLESLIRARAFLNSVMPAAVTRFVMRALDRACHEAGYVVGALNCARYLRRFPRLDKDVRLRGRMAVLNDLVALSLDQRDAVVRMSVDQDADADLLSSEALDHALEAGAPSIVLKILVIRKARGLSPLLSPDQVESQIDDVEALLVESHRKDIIDWLTSE